MFVTCQLSAELNAPRVIGGIVVLQRVNQVLEYLAILYLTCLRLPTNYSLLIGSAMFGATFNLITRV